MTQVDPAVSALKFARELSRLAEQRHALESRGIFVLGNPVFPIVEMLYVPRHFMRVAVPVQQSGSIIVPGGMMATAELPSLAARAFKARFDLSDFDLRAPSLEFRDFWTNEPLSFATMFRALEYESERKQHVVLLDNHPTTHKPFLCIRGIREYHEHPQHSGDEWLLYRKDMSLFSIALSVWRVCVDLIHPTFIQQKENLQVNWAAEEKD